MDRYNKLLKRDGTHPKDIERLAMFWILAGNDDLYEKIDFIYDFDNNMIKPECLESGKVDFCSGSRTLIKLAFNLYNSFPSDSVIDTFNVLDDYNFNLAIKAIQIRFGKVSVEI